MTKNTTTSTGKNARAKCAKAVSRETWLCRCEWPDGRVEFLDAESEDEIKQKADALMAAHAEVACFIIQSFVSWARAQGLVPVRPYRGGWLWDRVTKH
jgi:hypothetical protein